MWVVRLKEPVGKTNSAPPLRSLRLSGESFCSGIHRRGAEVAEITQRKAIFPTDSSAGSLMMMTLMKKVLKDIAPAEIELDK